MVSSASSDPSRALEQAERVLADKERKLFQLKALYDTARELATLSSPSHILDTFLLMTMGPLGVSMGFAMCMDSTGGAPRFSHRGLTDVDASALVSGDESISEALFGPSCVNVDGRVEISTSGLDAWPFLPDGVATLVRWCGPGEQAGLLALGQHLVEGGSTADDEEFLSRLVGVLITSLRNALAEEAVALLSRNLAVKNAEYEQALGLTVKAQREVDRRVFHLNTLYEATNELSGIVETRGILDTFLLTSMGAFSARQGGIYLHGETPHLVMRGVTADANADGLGAAELARFFETESERMPIPMSVRVLTGKKVLEGRTFPFKPHVAVAFSVDEQTQGILALGQCLGDQEHAADELDLLKALTSNFLVFLKNARYFEEVNELNKDLVQRNEELNRLLEEVSQCKLELSDVEMAREKILDIIRRETSRSSQVRRTDFVFILLVSLLVGLLFNFSNPNGVNLFPESWIAEPAPLVDVTHARELMLAGAVVVDARPAEFYRQSHIKEAVNVPSTLFDFVYSMRFADIGLATPIIVYGRTMSRRYDEDVAELFKKREFKSVLVLPGGLEDWEERGYPMERAQ
ncbi:rhodanese-like domain-containing protein [Desulfovibrio ferrophilus]|uniref:Rhodanese-related sulfurtransferase n=1 Tax=Desulfovibrio ferrophilus TaxID=241368 RepID=A0A2Z6AVV2_9BACT|nr:rhodanese-like domain-containing protein [Desulfovibrio ferrophilus]BBD07348.1 rhodanese-related sulfurtransferase [Desulfovibrio ferrophilus]